MELVEAGARRERRTTLIIVDHGKLPTAEQVFPGHATAVQELLSGTDRQFIHPRHGEDVGLVSIAHGPFCVGVGRVQTPGIECRETAVCICQIPRKRIRHQVG